MGRYTLTVIDTSNKKTHCRFNMNGTYTHNVPLKKIDEYTVTAKNMLELKNKLASIPGMFEASKIFDIKIFYQVDGKEKTVPIVYKDKEILNSIAMSKKTNINISSSVFIRKVSEFIKLLDTEDSFYVYCLSSNNLNFKQKEYITKRIEDRDYRTFTEEKLREYCSTYRQFRNLLFLMEEYKNLYSKMQDTEENEAAYYHETCDRVGKYNLLNDCYLEPEEIEKYDDSMDESLEEQIEYQKIIRRTKKA